MPPGADGVEYYVAVDFASQSCPIPALWRQRARRSKGIW